MRSELSIMLIAASITGLCATPYIVDAQEVNHDPQKIHASPFDKNDGISSSSDSTLSEYVQSPHFLFIASAETTPIKVIANGHSFWIPRNYLQRVTMDHNKAAFGIVTFFPDFKGATASNIDQYQSKNLLKVLNVIEIDRLPYIDSAMTGITHFIDDSQKYGVKDEGYGLSKIQYPWSKQNGVSPSEIFIHVGPTLQNSSAMVCDTVKGGPASFCTGEFDAAPGVVMQYRYSTNLLPHWQEINSRIFELLKHFQIEPKP